MATVNVTEGIKYGFGLMVYVFGVGLVGGIIAMVGIFMARGGGVAGAFIGGLIALAGILVIYAGMMGIAYKVVADGVTVGVEAAGATSLGGQSDEPGPGPAEKEPAD